MQTGKLKERVLLQSLSVTNNSGEVVKTYADVKEVWAEVISQKGAEAFQAAQNNSSETIKVRLRYRDDIRTTWRLSWLDNIYQIKAIDRTAKQDGFLWVIAECVVIE